ncbi:MAG: hypothetical protein Q8P71_02570 [bacterium]|nr:hypothetical protein [bacterium]
MKIFGMRKVGRVEIILAVVLLLLGGLYISWQTMGLDLNEEEEFVFEPTRWSADYQISEENGQTIVKNEEAGFSFVVPKEWSAEIKEYEPQKFLLEMTSPDARPFEGQVVLEEGCAVVVALKNDPDPTEVSILRASIEGNLLEDQEVIVVGGYKALKQIIEWFGTEIFVQIPMNEEDILLISSTSQAEHCFSTFENLLSSFVIT